MSRRYPTYKGGEPGEFNWRRQDWKMCCCDCGLVHRIRFAVAGHRIRVRVWRDNRATGQVRHHRAAEKAGLE